MNIGRVPQGGKQGQPIRQAKVAGKKRKKSTQVSGVELDEGLDIQSDTEYMNYCNTIVAVAYDLKMIPQSKLDKPEEESPVASFKSFIEKFDFDEDELIALESCLRKLETVTESPNTAIQTQLIHHFKPRRGDEIYNAFLVSTHLRKVAKSRDAQMTPNDDLNMFITELKNVKLLRA